METARIEKVLCLENECVSENAIIKKDYLKYAFLKNFTENNQKMANIIDTATKKEL